MKAEAPIRDLGVEATPISAYYILFCVAFIYYYSFFFNESKKMIIPLVRMLAMTMKLIKKSCTNVAFII